MERIKVLSKKIAIPCSAEKSSGRETWTFSKADKRYPCTRSEFTIVVEVSSILVARPSMLRESNIIEFEMERFI